MIEGQEYEWGVWRTTDNSLHRSGFDESLAREWVRSWNEEVAPDARAGMFVVCRRPIGEWEVDV